MPQASLRAISIDDATWSHGSDVRRHEWQLAIDEVVQEGVFEAVDAGAYTALLRVLPTRTLVEVRSPADIVVASHEVPMTELRSLMEDYVQICVQMSKAGLGPNSPQLEAFDIELENG